MGWCSQTRKTSAGQCSGACNAGWADCNGNKLSDGCEQNVSVNAMNCGGCGKACSPNHVSTLACGNGVCNGACDAGWADCNSDKLTDGCEADLGGVSNCGRCGTACSMNHVVSAVCSMGSCTSMCSPGYLDCNGNKQLDGCEVNGQTDINNCGACGGVCSKNNVAAVSCAGGVCNGACKAGFGDCNMNKLSDGCEAALNSSVAHCGACGVACSSRNIPSPSCAGGVCNGQCANNFADCNANKQSDGCEVNLATDPANCGGCAQVCSANHIASPTCGGGVCNGACALGWSDCNGDKLTDGCETNVATDATHCGSCGNDCARQAILTCTNGNCACATVADCDPVLTDTCVGGSCLCAANGGVCRAGKTCTALGCR